MFYPQDTTSFWADIQTFNPTLMGVIRGKQWSNNRGEMPAVNIKGCSSWDRNSSWDILVSRVTQIKMFPKLCSLILIQTSNCAVTFVLKSHIVLGQGQGVRNDFTAWNFPGSEIHMGSLAEMVNQFGRQIPVSFLLFIGGNGYFFALIRVRQYMSLLIGIVLTQGMHTHTDLCTSFLTW